MPRKSAKKLLEEQEITHDARRAELAAEYDDRKNVAQSLGADRYPLFRRTQRTKEEFVNQGLEKWDAARSVPVAGKFRDDDKVKLTFQQRFIDYLRTCFPNIFEQLTELVPYFNRFFGDNKEAYDCIFNWDRIELFDANESLNTYLYTQIKAVLKAYNISSHVIDVGPDEALDFNYDFKWGQYRLLFEFLDRSLLPENKKGPRDIDYAVKILAKNIALSNGLNLSHKTDETNILKEISEIIIQNYISSDKVHYFIKETRRSLRQSFEKISTNELDIDSFIKLHLGLLRWAETYGLEKDWILRYAYFFISKFGSDPDIDIQKINTPYINRRSLMTDRFVFKFDGWFPGDETREDYEKRLRTEFESSLEQFFQFSGKQLKLDRVRKTTKPLKYDCVKWDVYAVILRWNAEKVLEKFFREIAANKTKNEICSIAYENKLKVIRSEFNRLSEYQLPVPRNF